MTVEFVVEAMVALREESPLNQCPTLSLGLAAEDDHGVHLLESEGGKLGLVLVGHIDGGDRLRVTARGFDHLKFSIYKTLIL